jgi:DNA-binding response OmpR family regulator
MPKVLLVDDDARLRMNIGDWLEHQRYDVDQAGNGVEAKERLTSFTYDLIVLDWNLPDTEGVDICRWFRGRGGGTPILMLTGKDHVKDKVESFDAGADDYLTKPFELLELTARLSALLRRGGFVQPSRTHSLGCLVVDPVEHSVKVDGKEIQLTPKEFDILEFMVRHPSQVFSADALLDRLWKSDAEVSPDTVRVYIKRLREKLEKHGHGGMLKNIHGVGYKLVVE